jgi:hypothetical protein
MCIYHHKLDKGQKVSDEALAKKQEEKPDPEKQPKEDDAGSKAQAKLKEPRPQVTGVAYFRNIAERGQPPATMPPGILHCGCSEDDALLDFWWFKSGEITSPFSGVTEGWLSEVAEPRPRAFMAKLFLETTALTINDLYSVDSAGRGQSLEFRLKKQIARLQTKVDGLQEAREKANADLEAL